MRISIWALSTCLVVAAAAPVRADNALADGYQDMYNLRFDAAHHAFQEYEKSNPKDPMGAASDAAAYLFYEFERLNVLRSEFLTTNSSFLDRQRPKADPAVKREFEGALKKSQDLADSMLKSQPDARAALLANVVRIALHADYLALIEKDNWQALTEVKQARMLADALVQKYPDCYDAYLAVGVENYLLSQKMAPVRFFLKLTGAETDKQTGLEKLKLVASKGQYLKPYAQILLAIAALRDDKRVEAVTLLKQLAGQFPGNPLFRDEIQKLCEASLPVCSNS